MEEHRPNPDNLLKKAQDEERQQRRGQLKIYLGAAPGVGKTHEMLTDALAERAKGLDVVVGVAESHGRREIDNLLVDFVILPKKEIVYRNVSMYEFDLDAALKRAPALILLDEMAHTNVEGSRHKKRWQDIKELLDRGINVYTTLNVQHIESLNDDVAQIIHAPVKETVPDFMLEMADTLELVDLPPEELLQRLREGKVYVPTQAALAADLFFRKGNLSALRELALRTTAERVGSQILLYRQGQGIQHIWPAVEKLLVCVGGGRESQKLIRAAKRMANGLKVNWVAVYVDSPNMNHSVEKRNAALQNLRFAEQLGAETRVLTGFDVVNEIMKFSREQNVTQIMIFKHIRQRWRDFFRRSLVDEVLRHSHEIDVYIMTGESEKPITHQSYRSSTKTIWRDYFLALLMVGFTTVINSFLYTSVRPANLMMIYLLGVTCVALLGRTGPSVVASLLSVLAFGFFFVPPYNTLNFNVESIITLLTMLFVAQIISHLTIITRKQAQSARLIEDQTSALYTLSRQLANSRGIDKLLDIGTTYIAHVFNCEVLALLPHEGKLVVRSRFRADQDISDKELGVAQWVFEMGQAAGLGTDSLSFSEALYMPLLGAQSTIGVLRIKPMHEASLISPERMHLLEACATQLSLALEVDSLHDHSKSNDIHVEADRVRSALLHSISRDLRTPLVAIIGAASTQVEMADQLDARAIEKIGKEIYLDAEQLSRLINNLLQINYLETENINLQMQPHSIADLINQVINISRKKLADRPLHVSIPDNLPLVPFDETLIQEVLFNLIDNAVKFTTDKSPIDIIVKQQDNQMMVCIEDRGPGIMFDESHLLFEKYYRGRQLTTEHGLGLGLAICRMIIDAHGGKIWAENRHGGGALFCFYLPLA